MRLQPLDFPGYTREKGRLARERKTAYASARKIEGQKVKGACGGGYEWRLAADGGEEFFERWLLRGSRVMVGGFA